MTPVDSIGPPKKGHQKTSPSKPSGPNEIPEKRPILPDDIGNKKRLIWIIAGSITAIIFFGWVLLFSSGKITNQEGTSFFNQIERRVVSLWSTIKTDILKLQNQEETTNDKVDIEKIDKLEAEVFPQFSDPNNQ